MTLTRRQIALALSAETGLTVAQTRRVVSGTIDRIAGALAAGERVELRRLGIFERRPTRARSGRNPRTGEAVAVPAAFRVAFRPAASLAAALGRRSHAVAKLKT
jgi:nucleoid DNA-binding protein